MRRFSTSYRFRNARTGRLDGEPIPVDLAADAGSLGADVIRVRTIEDRAAVHTARASARTAIHVETDPSAPAAAFSAASWWDVPVSEVAAPDSTRRQARTTYEGPQGRAARLLAPVTEEGPR